MRHRNERDPRPRTGRLLLGLWLVLLGAALLLERAGLVESSVVGWLPSLLLIGLGLSRGLQSGRRAEGLWLVVAGVLAGLHVARVARLHETWPVFVVTAGAAIILGALDRRRPRSSDEPGTSEEM